MAPVILMGQLPSLESDVSRQSLSPTINATAGKTGSIYPGSFEFEKLKNSKGNNSHASAKVRSRRRGSSAGIAATIFARQGHRLARTKASNKKAFQGKTSSGRPTR